MEYESLLMCVARAVCLVDGPGPQWLIIHLILLNGASHASDVVVCG